MFFRGAWGTRDKGAFRTWTRSTKRGVAPGRPIDRAGRLTCVSLRVLPGASPAHAIAARVDLSPVRSTVTGRRHLTHQPGRARFDFGERGWHALAQMLELR
jgi:hypothetical protein